MLVSAVTEEKEAATWGRWGKDNGGPGPASGIHVVSEHSKSPPSMRGRGKKAPSKSAPPPLPPRPCAEVGQGPAPGWLRVPACRGRCSLWAQRQEQGGNSPWPRVNIPSNACLAGRCQKRKVLAGATPLHSFWILGNGISETCDLLIGERLCLIGPKSGGSNARDPHTLPVPRLLLIIPELNVFGIL